MTDVAKKKSGCFKYGCIGCVSIVALFFGGIFLLSAIQLTADNTPEPVERRTERPLPAAPAPPSPDGLTATESGSDAPESFDLPPSDLPPLENVTPGTLIVDLRMGEFTLEPGPADQPIRIEADFDASSFELQEHYVESEDAWTYRVKFGGRGGLLGLLLKGGGQNVGNRVKIIVPRGHPIRLEGEVSMGESSFDLGGLWVQSVDLDMGAGDHFIEFREPLPFPMESFHLETSMGGVEVRSLGEASPARIDVDHGMGDLFLDLEGSWRNDSDIRAEFSMGQCRLWLPDDVRVEMEKSSVAMGEARTDRLPDPSELPPDAPTLRISASGSMGELRIEN
ncbi:MAG: hypothetical protein MPN21_20975 [Thermoanaerobaculia bacterium]|nr:hypothetical protein [Thermoanaerobaculia bacterium]